MLLRMLILSYFFILHCTYAYADDLFATGWGKAVDQSAEGQLVFLLLQVVGICACFKAIRLAYEYNNGLQTHCGKWNCLSRFVGGLLLFYGHTTANAFYNTFF